MTNKKPVTRKVKEDAKWKLLYGMAVAIFGAREEAEADADRHGVDPDYTLVDEMQRSAKALANRWGWDHLPSV